MYRKTDNDQMYLEDFKIQFGGKLKADNRWVKLSKLIPWDYVEELYAQSLSENTGATAYPARIAFGSLYVKEHENLTDRQTLEYIAENPYVQYFLGLSEFQEDAVFDHSLLTHFRKRFTPEMIEAINKKICQETENKDDDDSDNPPSNRGKLVLDATVAPSDVRYPNDISLLNEARENTETMIDELWNKTERKGHKTGYSRKKARKEYLAITKQKQPKASKMRQAISRQLTYIRKNLHAIEKLQAEAGKNSLAEKRIIRLATIHKLYQQQSQMYQSKTHQCEERIVSLRQPHVRPIVRGKAGRRFEFGQKLAFSVINGFTFIEKQSFDNFNESTSLIGSVEAYKCRTGFYPEAVLADKIYRTRENIAYCKKLGIRLSGPRLGRPKQSEIEVDKKQTYQDNCERNIVESRNGIAKRRFGLGLIMAYLPQTAMTEAALQVLAMNLSLRLRLFYAFCKIWLLQTFFRRGLWV